MTDKEKLEKIKSLSDKMYTSMQNLTTDTAPIRKAMNEYHQFIIQHWHEKEPVSEDLEEEFVFYIKEKFGVRQEGDTLKTDGLNISPYNLLDIANHFANWQKEQMMKDAIKGLVICDEKLTRGYRDIVFKCPDEWAAGDRVIIIKEEVK